MFDFSSIERATFGPFPIRDKQYILKQASGRTAIKYRNQAAACARYQGVGERIGLASVLGIADLEPFLIQECMYEVKDGKEYTVTKSFVDELLPHITKQLFDKIKEMTPDLDGSVKDTEELLDKLQENLDKRRAKLRGEDDDPNLVNGSVSAAE